MKKTLIATAVAASVLAPISAQAVNTSADGTGEVVLFPYYNVNDGNRTFIGIANTSADAKVMKVRFREGVESEDVLDFQLWLSPFDHWTAVMSQSGGQVRIETFDTTCTVPSLAGGAVLFPNRISSLYEAGTVIDRLSEGHIEFIEMATIAPSMGRVDGVGNPILNSAANDLFTATKHVGGIPGNCDTPLQFNSAGSSPVVSTVRTSGQVNGPYGIGGYFEEPTGGVYGIGAVFNPSDATYFTYEAEAMQNFAQTPIFYAQRPDPYGYSAMGPTKLDVTADEVAFWEHGSLLFDLPDLSTPDGNELGVTGIGQSIEAFSYRGGAACDSKAHCMSEANYNVVDPTVAFAVANAKRNAVTTALQASRMANDFLSGQQWDTDWIFTFPGRYLFRDRPYPNPFPAMPNDAGDYHMDPQGPFTATVDRVTGRGCEAVDIIGEGDRAGVVDREEDQLRGQTGVGFSPGTPEDPFVLCYEVNVISINDDGDGEFSNAVRSRSVWNSDNNDWPTYGFAEVEFQQTMVDYPNPLVRPPKTYYGLPFIGFAAITDRSGAYTRGGSFAHKITRGDDSVNRTHGPHTPSHP